MKTVVQENVSVVYEDEKVAGFIHYDAKSRRPVLYHGNEMTGEDVAELIKTSTKEQ